MAGEIAEAIRKTFNLHLLTAKFIKTVVFTVAFT